MAPTTRTRRSQRAAASSSSPAAAAAAAALPVADGHNLPNGHGPRSPNGKATEASHLPNGTHHVDAHDSDAPRPWTPEPEPYDDDTYTAWGRKHFGEDWYQQRSIMLKERDIYVSVDPVYKARQQALRDMEEERQAGKLPRRAMTWDELKAWAPAHYGPVWCQHRDIRLRLDEQDDERRRARKAGVRMPSEEEVDEGRGYRHELAMVKIQIDRDVELLDDGKTWREIFTFPPLKRAEGDDGPVYRSPSPSSDGSGFRTFPPTPTIFHEQAKFGPMPENGRRREEEWAWDRSASQWDWRWEYEQWLGVHRPDRQSWVGDEASPQERYERQIKELARDIRSNREDAEGDLLRESELLNLCMIRVASPGSRVNTQEYLRRKRQFDRKREGWSQEQIDAEDQADPEPVQRLVREQEEERKRAPKNQEEMNLKLFEWNRQRFTHEEQERLGRMHGFPGRLLFPAKKDGDDDYVEDLCEPTRPRPKSEKEMDRFLFLWKLFLSDKELAELARMYGFDTDKRPDGVLVSRALPSPPPNTASARGRRATRKAPQSPSTRAARPRRSAPASQGPPPDQPRPGRASHRKTVQPELVAAATSPTKSRAAAAPVPRKNPRSQTAKLAQKPDTLHRRLSPDRVAKKPSRPRPRTAASVRPPVVLRSGRLSKAPERLGFSSRGE